MPVIPLISDTDENLETMFRTAKENGVDHVVTSFLFLRGEVKLKFLETINYHFPEIYPEFYDLYKSAAVFQRYTNGINLKLDKLRAKYEFNSTYVPVSAVEPSSQLSLF